MGGGTPQGTMILNTQILFEPNNRKRFLHHEQNRFKSLGIFSLKGKNPFLAWGQKEWKKVDYRKKVAGLAKKERKEGDGSPRWSEVDHFSLDINRHSKWLYWWIKISGCHEVYA